MNLVDQATQPLENYRTLPLSKGQVAIIDVADFEDLARFKWHVTWAETAKTFYAYRNRKVTEWIEGQSHQISMHRQIMGEPEGLEVDHRDGNGLDNRRHNLRVATHTQNSHNSRRLSTNKTGVKGVHFEAQTQKYRAEIIAHKKHIRLGRFSTLEEATEARRRAAIEYHGEFARLD